jgi:hypothetical protein
MSHTTTYKQKVTDISRFCRIASELGHNVKMAENGNYLTVNHYGGNAVRSAAEVHLSDWRYPLAVTATGEIMYDHFGSAPNTIEHLGRLLQSYNESIVMDNLPFDQLQDFNKETLENGDIQLVVNY